MRFVKVHFHAFSMLPLGERGEEYAIGSFDRSGVVPIVDLNSKRSRDQALDSSRLPDLSQPWRTIVGVVNDVSQYALDKKPPMQIYLPHSQFPTSFDTIVIKTENDPLSLLPAIRREISSVDKDQAVYDVRILEELQRNSIALRRFFMLLLMVFAVITLALAAVGIYGVMSYAVTQRTQEIGIRMALGASAADVLKLVVRSGIALAVTGVAIGLIAALTLTRLLQSMLFGVTPTDAVTFTIGVLGIVVVAVVACYIPARRATKVDPLVALRHE